ncbi:hypothetical protein L873DRAFT_1708815 [Choiromyces venosus 120613-1]|uniref:Phosphoglycerate mutase-like protein n=1 Tax=Choiromyces venosus 120613-1 TaxID=1336337 RepID=A0A3N4J7R4_9PEZI|nr:hypothetical protein L873DRAFT_1708815 [Choiromyces venosus 120613-1]
MPFSASAPSHIFIVRHGARLDMADAQWQLTSPTPYDTPLTYGGWTQSRLVGVRIATLIGNQLSQPSSPPMAARKGEVRRRKKAKKMRVVIHSSPFLRCIQTSVSIAAGIAQHHHQEVTNAHFVAENPVDPTPEDRSKFQFTKPLLRLDSWLGEWLAEDYYVDITPPPPTSLLIGTAKADYIRPSSASGIPAAPVVNASPLYNLSSLTTSLPTTFTGGYVPPSPTWAISNHGKIPTGYVSHAKDYVEFDLGWDSSKLGSGAEYGEEWASMHTRFKSGWKKLLWYYSSEDPKITTFPTRWKRATETSFSETMKKKSSATINTDGNPTPPLSDGEEEVEEKEEDEEIQTVLILVTHGAGCNALIGAITRQPVLIDIGISSLTMAIPEPPVKYDLKISANTDHLRSGTPLSTPPVSPNLRYGLNSLMPIGNFTLSGSGVGSMSTVFGNNTVRRSASSVGPLGSGNHGGLWSGRSGRESRPSSREEFSPLSLTGPSFASVVGEGSSDDGSSGSVTGLWDASGWERKRRWTVSRSEVPG